MSLIVQTHLRAMELCDGKMPESLERWTRDEPEEPAPPHNTFSGLWLAFKLDLAVALLCWLAWELWKAWR